MRSDQESRSTTAGAQMPERLSPASTPHISERSVIVNGLRVAVAMSDAPRIPRGGVPLVALPEAGFSWGDYRSLLEHFATERRVFALDWPGFGGSAKPALDAFSYTVDGYVGALARWLDTLGIAQAILAGNGIGGAA